MLRFALGQIWLCLPIPSFLQFLLSGISPPSDSNVQSFRRLTLVNAFNGLYGIPEPSFLSDRCEVRSGMIVEINPVLHAAITAY